MRFLLIKYKCEIGFTKYSIFLNIYEINHNKKEIFSKLIGFYLFQLFYFIAVQYF